jgi:pimeloyl-ACP methyl ester carboxylesterase
MRSRAGDSPSSSLRGHGRSSKIPYGHTVDVYAADVHAFIQGLGLEDVVLVGWSMGAMVIWSYFRQFSDESIKATVVVAQGPSDLKRDDWELGFDFPALCHLMDEIQTDRAQLAKNFIPFMFKEPITETDVQWMFKEITSLPESIASAILFDQSVQDYRSVLPSVTVPTLLAFGGADKLVPMAAGTYLQDNMPDARLVVFKNSSHCPFLEEPERFNAEVDKFIQDR